jgi:deoxyribose-phosphate aldolase
MYTKEHVARTIDHAVLKPDFTEADLNIHAQMCMKYNVYSMCVKPCDVSVAKILLEGSGVKVSTVLSFPHGADSTAVKVFQAEQAIAAGVDEIDMVMNIGRFLGEDYHYVLEDIKAVTDAAHSHGVIVKVIQESGFLTLEQVAKACELAYLGGADFVKTSTGFGPGKATLEVIDVMIKSVGDKMKIKASGGIRTWEDAVSFLEQGADRLGIGSTEAVLNGLNATGGY